MEPRIAIVGGGPAGMMAAIHAAETLGGGARVVLFDKNERLGRKIYLTGKGRCNLTNTRPWEAFAPHIHPNQGFLKHAFRAFSNEDTMRFFDGIGVPTVTLQGQRVYPASLVAGDVARALERRVRELGVDVRCGTTIRSMAELDGYAAVIIATGGKSYPVTGSTGDGYRFAEEAGHSVTPVFPSETALLPKDYDPGLPGLEMKNVGLQLLIDRQVVETEQGDFNFTDDGLESGIAYHLSRRAVWALYNGQRVDIILDLKPALSIDQLQRRLQRRLQRNPQRSNRSDARQNLFGSSEGALTRKNLPLHQAPAQPVIPGLTSPSCPASTGHLAADDAGPFNILDICTGSGCIAWSLAAEFPEAMVYGCDISDAALRYACRQRIKVRGAKPIFFTADVLADPPAGLPKFDVIVSNPPYICDSERAAMRPNVLDFEPAEALFVPDDDPMKFYRAVARWAAALLRPGGRLYLEINERFGPAVAALFPGSRVLQDISGRDRFVVR